MTLGTVLLLVISAVAPGLMASASPLSVDLSSAASFAVLAGTSITSTTTTVVTGDLGADRSDQRIPAGNGQRSVAQPRR